MWVEQDNKPGSVVPTLLALGASFVVALVVVIDILGMIAEGAPL